MADVSVQNERINGWIPSSATNVILNWPERIKTQPHDDRDNCFLPFDSKGPCGMTVNNDIDDGSATKHGDSHTSRQSTSRVNLVSVTQRFGAGDAEVGQWTAAAYRDFRAHAAPRQKTEQRLCIVYLVVSLPKLMIGNLMTFLVSPSASRSLKIHTAIDSDHKFVHRSTVPHELSSLSFCCVVVDQGTDCFPGRYL